MNLKTMADGRMGKVIKLVWRPVAGIMGLVALVLWSGGVLESKVGPGKLDHKLGTPLKTGTQTMPVKCVKSPSLIEVIGTAASERMVNLSARLPATIETMLVTAGSPVTNGQVLATLDDRDIQEQLAGAEAQFKQAEVENNRTQQLFEKGATTDQAKLAAQTGLEAARARLQQVRVMLSYATLKAPLEGVVTDRRFEAGDLVAPGQIVMSVYDPLLIRLEVPVPVRLLSKFTLGQQISVALDGVTQPVKGVVREIVSEVDPLSRTRKVKIKLDQAGLAILPGTYGRIVIEGDSHDAVWVPESAVYRIGQQEFVQVVAEGRVMRRIVRTGLVRDGQVEVISGLGDGELIVIEPVKEG